MVREFINYSICLNLLRYHWVPTINGNISDHTCFTRQTFFNTRELSLSLLLQSCVIWRKDCGHQTVKASFEFELIHMLIYFKYPCITTSVFLAAQFVVPVASYFWWHNKIGQNIVWGLFWPLTLKRAKSPLVQGYFWFEWSIPALCNKPIIVSSVMGPRY